MRLQLRGIPAECEVTYVIQRDAEISPDLATHGAPALAERVVL